MRVLVAIFAGLAAVDGVQLGAKSKSGSVGHYAKVTKVFEDMYSSRKQELEKVESDKKDLACSCDKDIARMTEEMEEATENQNYWQGQAESDRQLMQAAAEDERLQRSNIQTKKTEMNTQSTECQETQATYQAHLQTMNVQLAHTADAQTLVGQHLGKHEAVGNSFMQTGSHMISKAAMDSQAYSDADARIFTPDLKAMLAALIQKENVRIGAEDLKNVMLFLESDTRKTAHAFAQTGKKKKLYYCSTAAGAGGECGNTDAITEAGCLADANCEWTMNLSNDNATFEAVWKLLQELIKDINQEITQAEFDMSKHASACQNWINILQVEVDAFQTQMEKSADNYEMFNGQYMTAMNNMAQSQTQMDALEGDGVFADGTGLTWNANQDEFLQPLPDGSAGWLTYDDGEGNMIPYTNGKGSLGGCAELTLVNKHTAVCFDDGTNFGWVADDVTATAAEKAAAYGAAFAWCQENGRSGTDGSAAQCHACGFSHDKKDDGSLLAPQRCRMKYMTCGRGKNEYQARIDTLTDELEALSKAKEIMYQKEADFHAAAKFENALFFLQEDAEQAPGMTDAHNADLQPIVTKMVELINSEQDKRETNQGNYNSCNIQIESLKNDYDVAKSLVQALKDKSAAYAEDVVYYKESVRQLTIELDDLESSIHRLYNTHQSDLARVQNEISQMQPLIDTVTEVRDALLGEGEDYAGFSEGDQIIILVDRLKNDLVHEKSQLEQEQTDMVSDYNQEDQDLADQKLSVLQRRGDQQNELAGSRSDLEEARKDLSDAKNTTQNEYEEYHQKSVECNHLLTKYNEIQQALDEHISQLRQMLGLFTNLAKLPDASDQLHFSRYDQQYVNTGYQQPSVAETAPRVDNKGAAAAATPDTPAEANDGSSASFPGNTYLGNANNPVF